MIHPLTYEIITISHYKWWSWCTEKLNNLPSQTGHVKYISFSNPLSYLIVPVPWQLGHPPNLWGRNLSVIKLDFLEKYSAIRVFNFIVEQRIDLVE